MATAPRMSYQTLKVLSTMLGRPDNDHYALELSRVTDLKYGTVQPILVRLETHGWLESHEEDVTAEEVGRSPRRYYRLTHEGKAKARAVLQETAAFLPTFEVKGQPA